jgi:hypothetical protein
MSRRNYIVLTFGGSGRRGEVSPTIARDNGRECRKGPPYRDKTGTDLSQSRVRRGS